MKNLCKVCLAILAIVLLARCSQEDLSPDLPDQISSPHLTSSRDQVAARFSTGLSYALRYPEVRASLKASILERFDGDYNVLFAQIQNKEVTVSRNGKEATVTFGELILEGLDVVKPGAIGARVGAKGFFDKVADVYPLLQIALPQLENLSAEDWDTNNEQLPIAVVPETIIDNKLPALFANGETHVLSTLEEPGELVLVISPNERVIAIPRNGNGSVVSRDDGPICIGDPMLITQNAHYVLLSNYYNAQNDCSGGDGGVTEDDPQVCERDSNPAKDQLNRIKFTTIQAMRDAADQWWGGEMEIKALITYVTSSGGAQTLTKMYYGKRTDFRNCGIFNCDPKWVNIQADIITWTRSGYALSMNYMFFEYDGTGTSRTTTVAIPITTNGQTTTVTSSVTTVSSDQPLGESIVEYCDATSGTGTRYNTGTLFFEVNQQ